MESTLHLKVINSKGMHASPSRSLACGINTIKKNPDITVKVSCTGVLDCELVHKIIDLSKESFSGIDLLGYERGSRFDIEITGKESRSASIELKRIYIDYTYLEEIFVY